MLTCTVAVTGDSHFDASANGRLDECVRVHDWMLEDWARRGVDLILHGGDMYERKSVPADRNAAAAWVSRAADIAPVVIVKGNHDVPRDLEVFRKLEGRHAIRVEEASGISSIVLGERWDGAIPRDSFATVGAVAWPRKAELLARLPERLSDMEAKHAARECLRDIFKGLCAELEAAPEGPKILLMHAMTAGSKISVGQPPAGCNFEIDLADISLAFPRVGPMAVVMGHIHKPQDWTINEVPVIYAGSPRRTTYGELEGKSYVLLHFERSDEAPRYWELKSWERVPIPCQRLLLIEAQWQESGRCWTMDAIADVEASDIRFRYRFADEHRPSAKLAAEQLREGWLAAGADRVTLDPEVIRTTRARTEIATARTLEAKLMMLWQARKQVPPPAYRERLVTKARMLEQELLSAGAVPPRSVAFDPIRHRVRGFASLTDVDVKLHDLTGPLIAIVGGNGQGKSTFLETMLATAYRTTPTRKSLKWLATPDGPALGSPFSRATTSFCYRGQVIECRQEVSGNQARTCTSFVSVDNQAQMSTDGPTEFDAWVKQHLPPADLLYATIFNAQGSPGVIGMTAGDRKGLVLRLLGHERLELLAKRCGVLAGEQQAALQRLAARLSDLATATTVEAAQGAIHAAEASLLAAEQNLRTSREALDKLRAAAARATEIANSRAGVIELLDGVTTEQEQVAREGWRIRAAISNNEALLKHASEIRAAVADLAAGLAQQAEIEAERREACANRAAAARELSLQRSAHQNLQLQTDGAQASLRRLEAELRQLPQERDCAAAEAEIPEVEKQIRAAEEGRAAAEREIEALRAEEQRLTQAFREGQAGRIRGLRAGLGRIRDDAPNIDAARQEAASTLKADHSITTPPDLTIQMKPAVEQIADLHRQTAKLRERLAALNQTLSHRPRLTAIDEERTRLEQQAKELCRREQEAAASVTAAQQTQQNIEARIASHDTALLELKTAMVGLTKITEHADKLDAAEARIDELQKQLPEVERKSAALQERAAQLTAQLGAIPVWTNPTLHEIAAAERTVQAAERLVAAEAEAKGRARAAHERAVADLAKAQELQDERRTVEQELADYKRLAGDFGRNGIQALEIDAAGPRLTELANKLLHECHGPRFSVEVQTQRLDSTGKREIEDFVWMVTDAKRGRTGPVETLSGGEATIVGEALRWAHTLLGADGEAVPFVARDEPAGALSPENRIAYIKMLRAAAALAGTERVLFVSHQEELSEAADSRLLVDNGTVRAI